jgi:hypothetical protein
VCLLYCSFSVLFPPFGIATMTYKKLLLRALEDSSVQIGLRTTDWFGKTKLQRTRVSRHVILFLFCVLLSFSSSSSSCLLQHHRRRPGRCSKFATIDSDRRVTSFASRLLRSVNCQKQQVHRGPPPKMQEARESGE